MCLFVFVHLPKEGSPLDQLDSIADNDNHGRKNESQHALCKLQPGLLVRLNLTHPLRLLICRPSCISVGTRKGYSITNCDPFGRVYTMSASPVLCRVTDIQW